MSLSLEEYKAKLTRKILFADSQEEVKRFIDAAMKALEQNKVNGHIILRFVNKIIGELELFIPEKKDVRQESNIKIAKIILNRIKKQLLHYID
jgi:hypothetical protein